MKKLAGFVVSACLAIPSFAWAGSGAATEWELVNPSGVVEKAVVQPAPRLTTLENKTIVLRWNSKPNGDIVLNRIAEHIAKRVPSAKIIKSYEMFPEINRVSGTLDVSKKIADTILGLNPDLVIGAQAD